MRNRMTTMVVLAGLALSACGNGDDASTEATGSAAAAAAAAATTAPTEGEWLGGEPDWSGTADGDGAGAERTAEGELEAADVAGDDAGGASAATEPASAPAAAPAATTAGGARAGNAPPLRAGSVDDNADFEEYVEYVDRIASLGISVRPFDPRGRIVVAVNGSSGKPVAGAEVVVSDAGAELARLRTTADGTARFLPALYGAADKEAFDFTSDGVTVAGRPGDAVEIAHPSEGGRAAPVAVDVLFLLDATGSMSDEIDRLKTSIDSVAARVSALESMPDLRFGVTLYRDEGDEFVTSTFDFTGDVGAFRAALADVVADGGGDYPEALDESFAAALSEPSWRDPASTIQLVFLVADAPPHVARKVPVPYPASIVDAAARGIKVFPVASSESDDQAEAVFRQMAQATGARFVFLSYGAGGAATGGNTDIAPTDYEELALDELVVRLVSEELAALDGADAPPPPPPPPSSTTTTIPEGQ